MNGFKSQSYDALCVTRVYAAIKAEVEVSPALGYRLKTGSSGPFTAVFFKNI